MTNKASRKAEHQRFLRRQAEAAAITLTVSLTVLAVGLLLAMWVLRGQ